MNDAMPAIVPCRAIHPRFRDCNHGLINAMYSTALKILPLYSSIHIMPVLLFRLSKLIRHPVVVLKELGVSIARSVSFLSLFVGLYQFFVCRYRPFVSRDYRVMYFFAGIFSSLSLFVEKVSRRTELALYTLPRGASSFFDVLVSRKFMISIPFGDVLLFCVATSGLIAFYKEDSSFLSGLVSGLFKVLLPKRRTEAGEESSSFVNVDKSLRVHHGVAPPVKSLGH